MGRYSAPRLDDDTGNDDQAMAMDWDLTPDEDTGARHHDSNGNGNGDSRSLICYNLASDRNDQGHVNKCSRDENRCSGINFSRSGTEQPHTNLVQHNSSEKNRRIRRTAIVTAVVVVSIVLKRYAPPPPPLWGQSPFAMSSISIDSAELPINDSTPATFEITQHETWTSYFKHAVSYGLSVAWYAISNAFCYATEEFRSKAIEFLHGKGNNTDESLWMNWTISNMLFRVSTAKESQHNPQEMTDVQQCDGGTLNKMLVQECPIRLPAASILQTRFFQGATTHDTTHAGSGASDTEDILRQTVGASLSPQNIALKTIAEGIDTWGKAMVEEAPVALVRKMATALSASPNDKCISDETLSGWILPPSTGFLLVGPKGVGKLHTARCIAHLFFGHCSEVSEGVLEVIAGDHGDGVHLEKELIVNHIHSRRGIGGSVVIIHHIESLPTSILSEIFQVLNGKTDTLSHQTPENIVHASCNGTVFVLTSQWGTNSIFQHIQRDVLNALDRESLLSSIIREVDSHLHYSTQFALHTTVAPFFPFQQEDLSSILQSRVRTLSFESRESHSGKIEVSHATIKHAVGSEHVQYLDLHNENVGGGESEAVFFTYSASGAHALDKNPFWQTLQTTLKTEQQRSGLTLKAELDGTSNETVFSWCSRENAGLESCEEGWRS